MPKEVGEKEFRLKELFYLDIPSISLKKEICRYSREICLEKGIWMKYRDERGNILLTGHSFLILPPRAGIFYNLQDIQVGEYIYIYMLEGKFAYIVSEVFVASRYDLFVEDFSELEETLILYSCFPIWSASERIVVRARLCNLCENEI